MEGERRKKRIEEKEEGELEETDGEIRTEKDGKNEERIKRKEEERKGKKRQGKEKSGKERQGDEKNKM